MIWRKDINKVVLCLPDSWSNWNLEVLFFEKRKEKTSWSKEENQLQTQPTYGVNIGI